MALINLHPVSEASAISETDSITGILNGILPRNGTEKASLNSETGQKLIETVRTLLLETDNVDELNLKAHAIWESLHDVLEAKEFISLKYGILSEIAALKLFKDAGFETIASSPEQDRIGKIDLWAFDRDSNVFAIYVVGKLKADSIHATLVHPKAHYELIYQSDLDQLIEGLNNISREQIPVGKKAEKLKVYAVLLEIPTAGENLTFNRETGIPLATVQDLFYDNIAAPLLDKAEKREPFASFT